MRSLVLLSKTVNNILVESKQLADKQTLTETVKKVKSDKALSALCNTVDSLRVENIKPELAESYVNNAIKSLNGMNFSHLHKAASALSKNTKCTLLEKAIGVILFEKITPTNIREYTESFNLVKGNVSAYYTKLKQMEAINKKIKPLTEGLDDSDLEIVTRFMGATESGKIELYEELKSKTLNLLKTKINENPDAIETLDIYKVKEDVLEKRGNYNLENLQLLHNTIKVLNEG